MTNQSQALADKPGPDDELMSSFPSDAFLEKYFGVDLSVTGPGGHTLTLFNYLRGLFFFGMVYAPYKFIREDDWLGDGVTNKFTFESGRLSQQTKIALVGKINIDHVVTDAETFERELFAEMKAQFELGRLRNIDSWWEWFATEDSIGVKLTPDANPTGGNRPRRTFQEILDQTD